MTTSERCSHLKTVSLLTRIPNS